MRAANADYNSEYRNSCKVLTKYRLTGWCGCIKDKSAGTKRFDKGCSFAAVFGTSSCTGGSGTVSMRIGSGAYNYSTFTGNGWWAAQDGVARPSSLAAPSSSSSRQTFVPTVAFDSLAQTITVTLDDVRMVATNDSAYTLVDVKAWIAASDVDSIITPAKTYWSGTVILQLGALQTSGGFSPGDFTLTQNADSTWITAAHLVKVIPLTPSQLTVIQQAAQAPAANFGNAVLQMIGDGAYGAVVLPPVVPATAMPMSSPGGIAAIAVILVAAGWIGISRRRRA
jgi:hypothetical protein